jgi:hypothetical protein
LLAAGSSGADALQVTCTSGTPTVNSTHTLQDTAGNTYAPTESYAFPGTGTYDFDIEATIWTPSTEGEQTDLDTGTVLTFDSPPAGIQSTATLVAPLTGGRNDQTEAEGREAVVDYYRYPAFGGNWPEWQREIEKAIPGEIDAYVWFGRNNYPYGYGCVDVTVLRRNQTGSNRETTTAQDATIISYASDNLPVQMTREYRGLSLTTVDKTISVTYELAADSPTTFYCDWDAEQNKKTITDDDYTNKLIVVGVAYDAGVIEAGDKVFIAGKEATVVLEPGNAAAPVSGSLAKFTVDTWQWEETDDWLTDNGPGGTGYQVLAGGGLINTVFEEVRDHVDSLGPAKGAGTAAPIPGWQDRLLIAQLVAAASNSITGEGASPVDFTTTIDGAASDFTPTYDSTGSVELVIYDEIQIYQVAPA